MKVAEEIGTPRSYILKHVPAAAASILQHYELWPTHFIDVTRTLSIAVAFTEGQNEREYAYVYVFAMPDLRGSITSDMDQHISISRLEAICPPDAMRPQHQDAYLVTRFPEPPTITGPGESTWDSWQSNLDLMKRVVAKFRLKLSDGKFVGTPSFDINFLILPFKEDKLGSKLREKLLPEIEESLKYI